MGNRVTISDIAREVGVSKTMHIEQVIREKECVPLHHR